MSDQEQYFEIVPRHDILYVEMRGTWNEEQMQAYAAEYKRIVSRYFAREWACLINFKQLDMLIPESAQIHALKALNTWSYIKGMQAQAVIVGHENRSHLVYQMEEVFNDAQPYKKAVFYSDSEASRWLSEAGFNESFLQQSQISA